ncbi:hypothetical protein ACXR0O_09540 [Verrucomicrobiota bacterium sgz303538]
MVTRLPDLVVTTLVRRVTTGVTYVPPAAMVTGLTGIVVATAVPGAGSAALAANVPLLTMPAPPIPVPSTLRVEPSPMPAPVLTATPFVSAPTAVSVGQPFDGTAMYVTGVDAVRKASDGTSRVRTGRFSITTLFDE